MAAQYDVVIVGGGIQGVGIAEAAAAAGHSVLVLEKRALAAGTSSKSSKLVHGGLRYLERAQFRLVRESLAERRILCRIAPELVRMKSFFLPVYRTTRRRPWQLRTGLSLYAVLGGLDRETRFATVPRRQWDQLDGLRTDGLRTVLRYRDAQTDDAALTRAVMHTAQSLGAELAVPAEFLKARLQGGSVRIEYAHEGHERECDARVLVSAAGPWANQVARRIEPAIDLPAIELIQGAHLVVDRPLNQGVYYVESPRDGRAVFVMPWHGQTLIGTTETPFRGDPDRVRPLPSEINYLLSILRHYFPQHTAVGADRIADSFAGLRVLPAGPGHAFHRSRETLITTDRQQRPRFIGVYGGKLTTWRATAARVMRRIAPSLPTRPPRADTRELRLLAGE